MCSVSLSSNSERDGIVSQRIGSIPTAMDTIPVVFLQTICSQTSLVLNLPPVYRTTATSCLSTFPVVYS